MNSKHTPGNWECSHCGRVFEGEDIPANKKCPSDDCPSICPSINLGVTSGTWIHKRGKEGKYIVHSVDGYICLVNGIVGDKNNEANAKLISASPDLLEALQSMLDDGRGGHNQSCEAYLKKPCSCSYGKAQAAITKATKP